MRRFAALAVILAASCFSFAADNQPDAAALLARARQVRDAVPDAPIAVTSKLTLLHTNSGKLEGTVRYVRDGQNWRTEISVGSYREVRIVRGDTQYFSFTEPGSAALLELAQSYGAPPRFQARPDEVRQVRPAKVNGAVVQCLVFKTPGQVCFAQDGALVRNGAQGVGTEYGDYRVFHGVNVPGLARVFIRGSRVAEVVMQNGEEPKPTAADFEPPANAIAVSRCVEPHQFKAPKVVNHPDPVYPESERRARSNGYVEAVGVVGVDGSFRAIRVVEATSPDFATEAVRTFRQWKFEPATCDGRPVAHETEVEVTFRMHW